MDGQGSEDGEGRKNGEDRKDGDAGALPVLPRPVRLRLAQLAAEVLGGLPADDVPPTLRAIANFTPAKRARLGQPAITAALDADSGFRQLVADAVAEGSAQLAELVRGSEPALVSDPVDVAAAAYLLRGEGWTDTLRAAAEEVTRTESARAAGADEIARARAELGRARAELRGARRTRADENPAEVVVGGDREVARLRALLGRRANELRLARAETADAVAKAEATVAEVELRARLETESQRDELDRLRRRIADLEASAETARRSSRAARDIDEARLRLLLDTLTDAAAGVRRELSLPAGTARPADIVAGAGGAGRSAASDGAVRDPVELDRLLALPHVHLIVDGYNVTKTGYPDLALGEQRTRLVSALGAVRSRFGLEVTVVFDGAGVSVRPPAAPAPRGVRVLFSAGEIADDLIRRLVSAEPTGRTVVVVTSDQAVVTDVRRDGARTVPSRVLLDRLERA